MHFIIIVLFLTVLLPTNIPGFIEALIALPLSAAAIITFRKHKHAGFLSYDVGLLWIFALCALVVGTIYSRSSSISLITLIRYIEGCVLFTIAPYIIGTRTGFIRHAVTFCILTCVVFVSYSIFPYLHTLMPEYNSIVSINGHHPVAYTIIAIFPFLITRKYTQSGIIFRGLTMGVVFLLSAARGAWIIAAMTCIMMALQMRSQKRKHVFSIAAIVIICIIITISWAATLQPTQKETLVSQAPMLERFVKDTNLNLRKAYIQQAMTAIQDAPFTGHGPGTFELISRMNQMQPGDFSRYAHSFPVEVLAEQGLIGGSIILLLFTMILFSAARATQSKTYLPFGWSVIAICSYSIFETTLNHAPIWLLFWIIAGVMIQNNKIHTLSLRKPIYGMIGVLCIFFVISVFSSIPMRGNHANVIPSWMIIPNKQSALKYLHRTGLLTPTEITMLNIWHVQDPDIRLAMAERYPDLYPGAIMLDSKNTHALHLYIRHLVETNNHAELTSFLCRGKSSCPLASNKSFSFFLDQKSNTLTILPYLVGNDGYAKFLYLLGVNLYTFTGDSLSTVFLWQLARQEAPNWAFYYLEEAGAYYHWLNNIASAKRAIDACMAHPLAKKGCKDAIDLTHLLRPVLYSRDIIMIPAIQ